MSEKYGQRPSDFLLGRLGDFALDAEVFRVGVGIENAMASAAEQGKDGPKLVLLKLQRDAAIDRRAEERKRGD